MNKLTHRNWATAFKQGIAEWNKIKKRIEEKKGYTDLDLKYCLFFQYVTDYSIVSDEGIFKYKLPYILFTLWNSPQSAMVNLLTEVTDWEIAKAKTSEGVLLDELAHCIYLKEIVRWITKKRFTQNRADLRRLIAGEYRPKRSY